MGAKLKKGLLYGLAFLFAFVIGLRVTFPTGLLARILETQIESRTNHAFDVEIGRARLAGIVGIKLSDVSIESTAPVAEGERRIPVRLGSVRATAGLWSLIRQTPKVRADVRVGDDGRVRAHYAMGNDETPTTIRVELFEANMADFPPLQMKLGLPVRGSISGTVALEYTDGTRLSGGNIELGIAGLVFGPGEIESEMFRQFGGRIPIVPTDFGNVVIRAPIEGSDITVTQFDASGSDVRLQVSGDVGLRSPFRTSRLDLAVDLQLDGTYVEEAGFGAVLGLPDVQRLQVGSGYAFSISGPFGRPSVVPGARRSR